MDTRPVSLPDDLDRCIDVWLKAMNDVGEKQGDPPIAAEDVEWLAPSLTHLATTDPDRFLLVERSGEVIAFGCAFERNDFWFLSELMVLPESQGAGIGTKLLDAMLPVPPKRPGMTFATVVESRQPVSTLLYVRYGIVPLVPIYWLSGIRNLDALPALPDGVGAEDLDLDRDGPEIDRLDASCLGYSRRVDHRMFAHESDGGWVYRDRTGGLVAYAYRQPGHWVCPSAAVDAGLTGAILGDFVERGLVPQEEVTIEVADNTGELLPTLIRAGMRSDEGARLIYSSTGRVPPPSYLHFGGYHP